MCRLVAFCLRSVALGVQHPVRAVGAMLLVRETPDVILRLHVSDLNAHRRAIAFINLDDCQHQHPHPYECTCYITMQLIMWL